MAHHFEKQIAHLKNRLLAMGELVEQNVTRAIQAIQSVDTRLAWDVIAADSEIDRHEIEVSEECLHTLALYHPVASDIRLVASVLTINKDLERIGDLSVNLVEQTLLLSDHPLISEPPIDLAAQCETVLTMVRQSLESLIHMDGGLARRVIYDDDQVDQIHRGVYSEVKRAVENDPGQVDPMINLLVASRQLERIADHAVNIAEDVIYTAEAEIVRHRHLKEAPLPAGE